MVDAASGIAAFIAAIYFGCVVFAYMYEDQSNKFPPFANVGGAMIFVIIYVLMLVRFSHG